MATNKNLQLKQFNGTDYDNLFPKTTAEQVMTSTDKQFVTAAEKTKIAGALQTTGGTMTGTLTLAADPVSNLEAATKKYVDGKVNGLIDGAPEALDTLKELSAALNNDKDFGATITNELAKKLDKSEVSATAAANKVPQLDAAGKIPTSMLPAGVPTAEGVKIIVSATQPAEGDLKAGDFWYEILA